MKTTAEYIMLGNRTRRPPHSRPCCFFIFISISSAQKEPSITKKAPTIHSNTMGKEAQYNWKIIKIYKDFNGRNYNYYTLYLYYINCGSYRTAMDGIFEVLTPVTMEINNVNSVLRLLHRVDVVDVDDVSEVEAASIFSAEVCRLTHYFCTLSLF
jgi:hypothetical protein